jgi:hypothetical protein
MGGNSVPAGPAARRPRLRRLRFLGAAAALAAVQATPACTPSPSPVATRPATPPTDTSAPAAGPAPTAAAVQGPIAVEVNQLRDQYGKPEIQLQLTNTSNAAVTVTQAEVASALFEGTISWAQPGDGIELPPGQPKSLPAALPAAACGRQPSPNGETALATVLVISPGQSRPGQLIFSASDPFDVLQRNNSELCLATAVAAVASIRLGTQLEMAPDPRTAVVHLVVAPHPAADGNNPDQPARSLAIRSIDGTPLLAEAPPNPWPENLTVTAGDHPGQYPLHVRPARCDPHAIAEDKVGTVLPLHITVGAREGLIRVPAGALLRAQLYDFVTRACAEG